MDSRALEREGAHEGMGELMREREGESEREGERVCELCVREKLVLFFMGSRQMDKVVGNRSHRSVTPVRPVLTEPN